MVLIMVTSRFPADKATEVGNKYIELKKAGYLVGNPIGCTVEGVYLDSPSTSSTDFIIKSYTLIKPDKGRLEEVWDRVLKIMRWFAAGIDGYTYETKIVQTVEEALLSIGLPPPE